MLEKISAGKFKTHCLQVMEQVRKSRRRIIITKRNVPVAELGPVDEKEQKAFGKLKGSVHFHGNITKPIEEVWNADS